MKKRHFVLFLFAWLVISCSVLASNDVVVKLDVHVPMRDGIQLSTNIFLPNAEGSFPTILLRTPYGNGDANNDIAIAYAKSGYAYVIQDTRGRFESQGVFNPFMDEAQDGYDCQEWICKQSWSNGKIGMTGSSYVGFTQWISAPLGSPAVKAILPVVTFTDFHDDVVYVNGAFQLALSLIWAGMVTVQPGEDLAKLNLQELFGCLPLTEYSRALGREISFYNDWLAHPDYDDYWLPAAVGDKFNQISIPSFSMGNWYDIFSKSTVENFQRMRKVAATEKAKRSQKLLMGPGAHGLPSQRLGERDFGENATIDFGMMERRWFDYWLKDEKNDILKEAPVRIFVMGINRWRDEQEWPLARTRYEKYYLHGEGKANSFHGDGILNTEPPEDEPGDVFNYDPNNPVPTTGGCNMTIPAGPFDQRKVEERSDVLIYTTAPLKEPVEVTGPIHVTLYASSSALDTDFTAKLVDVCPDGIAWNLADGIIRARYRNSGKKPELIEPGKIYKYDIDLWVTSNVFLQDHCIRLEISSSNFPRFDRNPNTGHAFGNDADIITAKQTVYHNSKYPSCVVLPIIPSDK
jgi:hypothetical protein